MKEKDVMEELKRNPLKVFHAKRYPNIRLEVVNGAIYCPKLIYISPNEEWEEVINSEGRMKMKEQEVRYVFNGKIYNITKSEKLYEYKHKEKTNMLLLGQYPMYRDAIAKVYESRRGNFFMTTSSNGRISIKDITIDEFLKILTENNELDLLKSIFPSEYNKLQEA